jgi:hypothetical protein
VTSTVTETPQVTATDANLDETANGILIIFSTSVDCAATVSISVSNGAADAATVDLGWYNTKGGGFQFTVSNSNDVAGFSVPISASLIEIIFTASSYPQHLFIDYSLTAICPSS